MKGDQKVKLDGGKLGNDMFRDLTENEKYRIMNCISQFSRSVPIDRTGKTFFCIQVWFPDDANAIFKSNTPSNGFMIRPKLKENFVSKDLLEHAEALWEYQLVPIEINREGKAAFYALPREEILTGNIKSVILYAESNNMPTLDNFGYK